MGFKERLAKANEAARQTAADNAEERQAEREKLKEDWKEIKGDWSTMTQEQTGRERLSEVGKDDDGTLRCPKCGGQQFTAKRSKKGKIIGVATVGVGALLAPKSQVKCVTCGTMFKRG